MVNVMELPPELLSAIASKAPLGDVLELRLVCKGFAEALIGIALRRVVIDTNGRSEIEGCRIEPLKTLAEIDEHHSVRVLARSLEIKRWSPDSDLQVEAIGYLEAICRNLTRVESLKWSWGTSYPSFGPLTQSTDVVRALQPMSVGLREIELLAFQNDQMTLLDDLSSLTRLIIEPRRNTSTTVAADLVWKRIASAISRSQDTLQDLVLSLEPERHDGSTHSIQDVLSNEQGLTSLPRIRSLSLSTVLAMRLRWQSPVRFSSLQSLSLQEDILDRVWPDRNCIFVALRQSGIRLQQVAAPDSIPLVEYLASYEGTLQEVAIVDCEEMIEENRANRTALALRFFREVIPKHQSTLRKIEITTSCDNGWAFGDLNTIMFSDPFPMLEWLSIAIRTTGMNDHIKTFLDRVLRPSHFPLLQRVDLRVEVVAGYTTRGASIYDFDEESKLERDAALDKLRRYSLAFGREAGLASTDWVFPRLFVETFEFRPCLSRGLLHFEPVGKNWDNLYDDLAENGWKW
ncbi:hypothetical protein BKA70DRAFT_1267114 [Coprinopsis sp. MPI-PUGE-AT-0042]|nr:hypothetical protein BKA70DRAFT_1267114 [Coprinopsis sp. MPI-PUGE-AT-0042]